MFADNGRSAKEFTALKDDIVKNGLQDKVINFVEVGGQKYIVNGNDRLRVSENFLKNTDDLIFEQVQLPFRGYKTPDDVVGEAMDILDNMPRGGN